MSIAEREAEELYPPRHYDNYPTVLESFYVTSDDLQEAYVQGREAEPCDEQIEAVARILFDKSWVLGEAPVSWEEWCDIAEKDSIIAQKVKLFRDMARTILDAARKAVSE